MLTIYHNPNCSKSRGALQVVQQFSSAHNEPLHVVEYLKTPLTRPQLLALQQQLNITSLQTESSSLEDVFRSLTTTA